MSLFDRIPEVFRVARFRADARSDLREEIDFYLAMRTRELMEKHGLGEEEAARLARGAFGDRNRIEAEALEARARTTVPDWLGDAARGLRRSVRALARRPGFSLTVLATLGLGIGGSTTMFTVVDSVLFRPLPYPAAEELVSLRETNSRTSDRGLSPLNFLDARAGSSHLRELTAYRVRPRNLLGEGEPERLVAGNVSANFFATFGVPPDLGRTFGPEPAALGDSRSVVLSYGLWARRFGADPGVIGTTIRLDREVVEIAGVMPADFRFPSDADLWIKARGDVPELSTADDVDHLQIRDAWYFSAVGRLRPGSSLAAAQTELDGIASRIRELDPGENGETGFLLTPLRDATVASARSSLLFLLGTVALLLLIACTNVANLVTVRVAARSTELSVRVALGAGRGGLVRHLLGECLVLGAGGAIVGAGLALAGTRVVRAMAVAWLPRADEVFVDARALLFTVALTGVAVLIAGLLPVLSSSRASPRAAMGSREVSSTPGERRLGRGLVIGQTALAVLLVVAAGLALKSVWTLSRVDLGFESRGMATLPFMVPGAREMETNEWRSLYREVVERVGAVGGVESVALATRGPVSTGWQAGLRVQGREYDGNNPPDVGWQVVSENYFESVGIPILEGRSFLPTDGPESPAVAVVNEGLAELIWPHENPVGQRINTGLDGPGQWVTVVGVAGNTRNRGPIAPTLPAYFRPLGQPGAFGGDGMMLLVKTAGDPAARIPDVQRAAWSAVPELPFYRILVEDEIASGFTARPRFLFGLLVTFAAVALLLGAVGIYGVMAHSVEQRTRELGIRMALGAQGGTLLTMVLRQSLTIVVLGLVAGVSGALALTRVLEALLPEVSATDAATYVAVAGVFLVVAGVAALVPALRASRIDPAMTMRAD